jgi:16S rRNA processing protein RimM
VASQEASGPHSSPDGAAQEQAAQTGQQSRWTWLARIRRPQGRKGEVFADILTDFPEKFADRRRLWLIPEKSASVKGTGSGLSANAQVKGTGFSPYISPAKAAGALAPEGLSSGSSPFAASPREMALLNHWLHKGGIVLHFSGVESISDAETLAGLIVAIPREERALLAEDETYIGDLIGCALVDVAGVESLLVGEIEDVDRAAGPVALLVVRAKDSAGEILVPFAKGYLRKIDIEAKRVEMALPEGLIDLNAPQKP